ncbi:MAG: hypothetical protein HFI08_00465 [Bacilli bacterium]|nr:hypothetical protein [Bacilli bacterium]
MAKNNQNPSTIQKMWHDKKGKAIIKLGLWVAFLLLIMLMIPIMNLFNKTTTLPQINEKPNNDQEKYKNINEMWENLLSFNYQYQYQVSDKLSNETILFQGKKVNGIDTGYRESKIGIIKYRIEENHIYQILVDSEEEITFLYEEEDKPFLNLQDLHTKLNYFIPAETISGTMRTLNYQNGDETIEISTTLNEIKKIRINTAQKEYNLLFDTVEQVSE